MSRDIYTRTRSYEQRKLHKSEKTLAAEDELVSRSFAAEHEKKTKKKNIHTPAESKRIKTIHQKMMTELVCNLTMRHMVEMYVSE